MSVLCFYKFNLSFFENDIQNLSGIFSCPEFVWFKFFMSGICPGLSIKNLSGIFHVRNLFGLSVQNLSRIFHVRNLFWIHLVFVQIYCPEFVQNFYTGQILNKYWTNSGRSQIPDIGFVSKKWTISGRFPDILDNFRTFLVTISGHLFFIGPFVP